MTPDFDALFAKMPRYPQPRIVIRMGDVGGLLLLCAVALFVYNLPEMLRSHAPAHVEGMP